MNSKTLSKISESNFLKYLRNFGHDSEYSKFEIFKKNAEYISEHDYGYLEGINHAEVSINEFADLSDQEFKKMLFKYKL